MGSSRNYLSYPVKELLDTIAGVDPVPGGGSAAALAGAVGLSCIAKVATIALSQRKKNLSSDEQVIQESRLTAFLEETELLRDSVEQLIDRDAACFQDVVTFWKESKKSAGVSNDEKEAALKACVEVSLELCQVSRKGLNLAEGLALHVKPYLASDVAVGRALLQGACDAAVNLIKTNLACISDEEYARSVCKRATDCQAKEEEPA